MAAGGEFVEGWLVAQVLGEGAYGEVRLLLHARSGAAVALKVLRGGGPEAAAGAAREAGLHRALRHPHVLRCLGERVHQGQHYLFLEYAAGGELFDRIEPDAGMREGSARGYWRQLLLGLRYLHARGVAHRDIKPENLLLDHQDRLKISDFGMATLFRHGARERLMSRVCGTLPYAAPEVLAAGRAPYRAAPADLWAAALVLLAMLAGELPWERASDDDERYAEWAACLERPGAEVRGPWRKLSAGALALLRRALAPAPERRADLGALLQHAWTSEPAEWSARAWRSQPAVADTVDAGADELAPDALSAADMDALISHSQPAAADELLLGTPGAGPRRGSRVRVRGDGAAAVSALTHALRARGYAWRRLDPRMRLLAVECGAELKMRAWALPAPDGSSTVLEFRRWRGCGLQFKRRFAELRDALDHLRGRPTRDDATSEGAFVRD